jgi:hypothetical protein
VIGTEEGRRGVVVRSVARVVVRRVAFWILFNELDAVVCDGSTTLPHAFHPEADNEVEDIILSTLS